MRIPKPQAVALAAAVVLAAVLGIQGPASASSTQKEQTIPVGPLPSPPVSYSQGALPIGDWNVGDCYLVAGSFVAISGNRVYLHAITGTGHTNSADIWHNNFAFLNSRGVVLYQAGGSPFDSPRMVPANGRSSGPSNVYHWERETTLAIDPSLFLQVASIRWQAAC